MIDARTNRQAWLDTGWLIEHTGGGCEALTRYYRTDAGAMLVVVLTADLAVPDGPDDPTIDAVGVYVDTGDDPDGMATSWGDLIGDHWLPDGTDGCTYAWWATLADVLAARNGAVRDITWDPDPDPYRGAGLAPDVPMNGGSSCEP